MTTGLDLLSTVTRHGGKLDRIVGGMEVIRDSLAVLAERPILLAYPLVGGAVASLWIVLGIGVVVAAVLGAGLSGGGTLAFAGVVLVGTYVAFAYTNVLFAAALIHEVRDYNRGVDLSLRTGLDAALANWSTLLLWTLVSWTVGVAIRWRRRNADGFTDRLLSEGVDAGWTAATFFVVPVILFEDANWRTAAGKTADRLTDSWAEVLGAVVGLRLVAYAISLVGGGIVSLFSFLFIWDTLGAVVGTLVAAPVVVLGVLVNLTLQGVVKGTMYDQVVAESEDAAAAEDRSFRDVVSEEREAPARKPEKPKQSD